jgi:hypothetical protein
MRFVEPLFKLTVVLERTAHFRAFTCDDRAPMSRFHQSPIEFRKDLLGSTYGISTNWGERIGNLQNS